MGDRRPIGSVFSPGALCGGRYVVRSCLARGATASIFLADDVEAARAVALKVLAVDDEREGSLAAREAQMMARVDHDNVARTFGCGEHEGWDYLVLEHISGHDLRTWGNRGVADGQLPSIDAALSILRQLCSALDAVHAADLVHRDVKPANVMIDARGRVRLIDFGTAQRRDEPFALIGTPLYIAPELTRSRELAPTTRHLTDVFALGVLSYVLLSAREPFVVDERLSLYDQLQALAHQRAGRLETLRPDLPEALCDAIDEALSPFAEARPPSAGAFYRQLARAATRCSPALRARPFALEELYDEHEEPLVGMDELDTLLRLDLLDLDRDLDLESTAFAALVGSGARETRATVPATPGLR